MLSCVEEIFFLHLNSCKISAKTRYQTLGNTLKIFCRHGMLVRKVICVEEIKRMIVSKDKRRVSKIELKRYKKKMTRKNGNQKGILRCEKN